MDEEKKEATMNYAVVYYVEDDTVKKAFKGIRTSDDTNILWRLSNFLDDLLLSLADKQVLYAMICRNDFPVDDMDKLIKKFLKDKDLKIKKVSLSEDYV